MANIEDQQLTTDNTFSHAPVVLENNNRLSDGYEDVPNDGIPAQTSTEKYQSLWLLLNQSRFISRCLGTHPGLIMPEEVISHIRLETHPGLIVPEEVISHIRLETHPGLIVLEEVISLILLDSKMTRERDNTRLWQIPFIMRTIFHLGIMRTLAIELHLSIYSIHNYDYTNI